MPSVILFHGGHLTYPNDPTGPSLDRPGDYDPDWDFPPDEVPADWMTRTLDVLAESAFIMAMLLLGIGIVWVLWPAAAEAHVPGADLGPSQGTWLTNPYSPIPQRTLEATLDAVSKTPSTEIFNTMEILRGLLYVAAVDSIGNWERTDASFAEHGLDDPCWRFEIAQQRLWYELAQFYHNPPRSSSKRRLVRTLRNLVAGEVAYRACWETNRPHEGDLSR